MIGLPDWLPAPGYYRRVQRHTHDVAVGSSLVRKRYTSWGDGEPDREWMCLSLLAEHAPGVAPRPLARVDEDRRPVVIMERVPGEPLTVGPVSPRQLAELGRALQAVYAVPREAISAAGLPERRFGPTVIRERLATALSRPHRLAECDDPKLVQSALDRALAHVDRPEAVPTALLRCMGIADLNPANVLWDGRVCRLVDFEDGGKTDPAFELADHVEHIANRLAGTYEPTALCDAVGLTEADVPRFEGYRALWAIFWLIMLLPGNAAHTRNPRGTLEGQAVHVHALLG